jgi:hypothetical protein
MSKGVIQSFPCFSKLPAEVQLLIWGFTTLRDPRIIHITNQVTHTAGRTTELYEPLRGWKELSPLLSSCRDSRQVYKRNYVKLCVSTFEHEQPIYFDPSQDTLYLDVTWDILYRPTMNKRKASAEMSIDGIDEVTVTRSTAADRTTNTSDVDDANFNHFPFLADKNIINSIRHLAMEYKAWHPLCHNHRVIAMSDFFPSFPSLETFNFVFGDTALFNLEESFTEPLEPEDIQQGSRFWEYRGDVTLRESRAAEQARMEYPGLKLPKFGVKVLKTTRQGSMTENP